MAARSSTHVLRTAAALGLAAFFAVPSPLSGQTLQQQNQEILNELKAIHQLLEKLAGPLSQPAPPSAPVNEKVTLPTVTGYVLGRPDAPLTMVEFTDLQCPFCRQFHMTAFEQIKKDYIDTGRLRYISRDFPLDAIHPYAVAAARAVRCAADEGRFWDMRHTILVNNAQLNKDVFATFARDLKLDLPAFANCTADGSRYQSEMQKDLSDGTTIGVQGTPTFVIGRTSGKGLEGVRLVGAQPYATFDARLKELLGKPATNP